MNLEHASDLERLIEVSQTWPITDVPFEVCMDPLLDETTTVNLAHHIEPDTNDETAIKEHLNAFKVDPRCRDPMAYPKMYLPPHYNTNDKTTQKQVIIPLISNALNVDGGGVVSKGWEVM